MSIINYQITQIEIRVLIRHYWKKGLTIRETADIINAIEGNRTVAKTSVGKWFHHFNEGNFDINDKHRSGRPSILNENDVHTAIEAEPSSSTRDLENTLGVSHTTVRKKLHELQYIHKKPRQEPHELTQEQAKKRVDICSELLNNSLNEQYWKRIITSDEKWIYLVNHNRDKQWVQKGNSVYSVPKLDRFSKKVMLCVWWNYEGIVHYELVPNGCAINAELYCQQIERVYNKLKDKYPDLIRNKQALMQQDNAKPHTARMTKEKFEELEGIEILPHPAYSPDCAPSDYGLFRSMQHFLKGKKFESYDEVEIALKEFFDSKSSDWYFGQIRNLAHRWQLVIENEGLYFEE